MTFREAETAFPGFRTWCREQFVGNETDTDEYGETQPAKGFGYVAELFERTEDAKDADLLAEVLAWVTAIQTGGRYDGADELQPLLARLFDLLWEANEHPYCDSPDEYLLADFEEDREYAKEQKEAGDNA